MRSLPTVWSDETNKEAPHGLRSEAHLLLFFVSSMRFLLLMGIEWTVNGKWLKSYEKRRVMSFDRNRHNIIFFFFGAIRVAEELHCVPRFLDLAGK